MHGDNYCCKAPVWKQVMDDPLCLYLANYSLVCLQVCWGPLSFIVASMIATDHPFRHPLQAVVSLGQLYGDVLYYATSMFDHYILNLSYSRPEAFYFWGYFVFTNAFWIIIPLSESLKHWYMYILVLIDCRTSIRQRHEKWQGFCCVR